METRDFLEKQIDQLGQMLTALFNKVLKRTEQGISIKDDEIIQTFQDELLIDLTKVSELNQDELIYFLINKRGYNFENLEKLAKVISLFSSKKYEPLLTDNTLRSLELSILDYLTANDKNFSLERQLRVDYLKKSNIDGL